MKKSLPLLAFAALFVMTPQSEASPVYSEKINFMILENDQTSVGFETEGLEQAGQIEVVASPDSKLSADDQIVGSAAFEFDSVYAEAKFSLDDKLVNPGGKHTWTLFYRASSGIELNRSSDTVVVQDEDVFEIPVVGTAVLGKSSLTVPMSFPDAPAEGKLVARAFGKTIGTADVVVSGKFTKVKFKLSKKLAKKLAKGSVVHLEFSGQSQTRRLDSTFKLKFS